MDACWVCGNYHPGKECRLKDKSWANQDQTKHWSISKKGREWKEKGFLTCPMVENPSPREEKPEGEIFAITQSLPRIECRLIFLQGKGEEVKGHALLDTGASANYIRTGLIPKEVASNNDLVVHLQSAFSNENSQTTKGSVRLRVIFHSEDGKVWAGKTTFFIIESDMDLILGRKVIKEWGLVKKFPSHFHSAVDELTTKGFSSSTVPLDRMAMVGGQTQSLASSSRRGEFVLSPQYEDGSEKGTNQWVEDTNNSLHTEEPKGNRRAIKAIRMFQHEDMDEIKDEHLQSIPSDLFEQTTLEDQFPAMNFHGPRKLQEGLKNLVQEYQNVFQPVLSNNAARVEPYDFSVKLEVWERPENQLPPRKMDRTKDMEMKRQVDLMLENGILEESRSSYYSHALMVPKSDGQWRFCVDFKNLNKATEKEGWPIPNIKTMLERIGGRRPKYFIVLDLTSGYFQIPMARKAAKYTAFITQWGLYQWKRMPMGLKGAPAFFQRTLATKVLAGLIMNICELYLDDLNVYAKDGCTLIENFRKVLERFRRYNIFINPKKCRLGLTEVVYVGHSINESGLHFAREKLESVLKWDKPTTMKGLKSFLGMANFFRDHVKNHSLIVSPLHRLLEGYGSSKMIQWTEETELAFELIKRKIYECPRLHFLDDESPIHLYTDASDKGVGANLVQVVDGVEYPIGFLSKAFVEQRMKNWSVPQK